MPSVCASCMRALRQHSKKEIQLLQSRYQPHRISRTSTSSPIHRSFSTTRQLFVGEKEETLDPQRKPQPPLASKSSDPLKNFASTIRESPVLKQTTEPYIAYGTTSTLLAECSRQISYTIPSALANPKQPAPQNSRGEDIGEGTGWWYTPKTQGGLGLEVTFGSWSQVMFLYLYCLTVRLRCFPEKHARIWHQQLLDHFFYAAEDRMAVWHNISTRGVRNKYLKDLWQQWRGVLLSYDEGIIKGDAVMAGAVWRNVFKGDEEADVQDIALVTAYLRSQLKMLDGLSDLQIGEGRVEFQDPGRLRKMVDVPAPGMKRPFSNEEVGATKARVED